MVQRRINSSLVLLLLASALAFLPSLSGVFVYDDFNDIVQNPSAHAETFLARLSGTVRPLLKASYALQDALFGMNAVAFHAVNFALHLLAVLLVFHLIRRFALQAGSIPDRAARLALVTTLLWALHPALSDTVSYVSGRSMGLSSVLLVSALLATTRDVPRRGLAFVFAVLAPLARETALVAPLLLLVWQVTLGRHEVWRQALRRALPLWLGAGLAALVLALMARHRELLAFSVDQRGAMDSLRANVFASLEILRLWVLPWQITILPRQPVIYGWGDPATLIRLTAITLVPLAALLFRRRAPLVAFALLWTLVALLPSNSLIWRVDPVALKPLYLAGLGLSLLLAKALVHLRFGMAIALVLTVGVGTLSFVRAGLYRDEVALFQDAVRQTPDEPRAQLMLGLVLANAGRTDEARAALRRALALDPFDSEAKNALRLLDAGR